jgi:hypothetical protein
MRWTAKDTEMDNKRNENILKELRTEPTWDKILEYERKLDSTC